MEYAEKNSNRFIHLTIFIFLLLSSISFMTVFQKKITDYFQILSLIIGFVAVLLHFVYSTEKPAFTKNFNIPILLIFLSVFLSMISAYILHNQGFAVTAVVQRPIYFYLIYFALHYFAIKPSSILKIVFAVAIIHVFIYFLQYFLFPKIILNCRVILDRNTVRVYMPGSAYAVFTFFFALHIYFQKYQVKYLIICLIMFLLFLIGGSRQVLGSVFLATALYLLITKRIKNKFLVVFVALIGLIPLIFMIKDMLIALLEVSQRQSTNIKTDPRTIAINFFLFEYSPHKLSYLLGNGAPSLNSAYGRYIFSISDWKDINLSDIGILGEYFKYGVLFVIAQLVIIIKIITMKLPDAVIPFKFLFFIILMTLFTGAGAFGNDDNIVFLCIIFYLIDVAKDKRFTPSQLNEMFVT